MKSHSNFPHYFIIATGVAMVIMIMAMSCEEIVEVEKIVIQKDTVTKYIDRYFAGTDSVEIPVVVETPVQTRDQQDSIITVIQYDTVYQVRIDSIYTVVTEYDTIVERIHYYNDTLVQYLWPKGAYGLPTELEPIYNGFFEEVDRRGITYQGSGSAFLIQFKSMDSSLQAYSFDYGGQILILISDKLTVDQCYVVLWRELSRVFLKNEYSADPDSPMNPFWPGVQDVRWSNRNQFPEVADEIFN